MNMAGDRPGEGERPDAAQSGDAGVGPPGLLLQQLHQVQEELEQYYLRNQDMDAQLQVARLANDDAKREIQALRMQLQRMQRALSEASADRPRQPPGRWQALLRVVPGPFRRRVDGSGAQHGPHQQAEIVRGAHWFDGDWYLATYPDVRDAGMDPAEHYHEFGWAEARNPGPLFDTAWYLRTYPDVAAAGIDPLLHFVEHGEKEGRLPREP